MRSGIFTAMVLASVIFPAVSFGADAATEPAEMAPPPVAVPPYIVTGVREQTMPAVTYLYMETDTTMNAMRGFIDKSMKEMGAALTKGDFHPTSGPIFLYDGITGDRTSKFHLSVGFPVASGTEAMGNFKVKKLEPFHCASILFSGSTANFGAAYRKLFSGMPAANMIPNGQTREYYLYWESGESPNNVMMIQSGLRGESAVT